MAFKKPKDYEDVRVGGDYRILPAGGYVCKILKAEEMESSSGKPMLKIAFDIFEGEFENYFKENFESRKANAEEPKDVKWPFAGTKWILLYNNEGATNRDFKSLCTSLEDSGFEVWKDDTFDTNNLKNAKVGIIFRREESEYQNSRSWRTVPFGFRSVKTIKDGNFNVPDDKPLAQKEFKIEDNFSAAEDDIPF